MDLRTLIVIPVLRRPHRVPAVLQSIARSTPEPHRVLFVANQGDDAEIDSVRAHGAELLVMPYPHDPADWRTRPGEWANKIQAAIDSSDEPFVFTGADDLDFHPGWLTAALRPMIDRPKTGLVGTNDLGSPRVQAGRHATHFLLRRSYVVEQGTIDEPGRALCNLYPHEYTDDEAVATAKHRDAWAFAADSIVEHAHANWGKAQMDELYRPQRERMAAGREIYLRRCWMWGER